MRNLFVHNKAGVHIDRRKPGLAIPHEGETFNFVKSITQFQCSNSMVVHHVFTMVGSSPNLPYHLQISPADLLSPSLLYTQIDRVWIKRIR